VNHVGFYWFHQLSYVPYDFVINGIIEENHSKPHGDLENVSLSGESIRYMWEKLKSFLADDTLFYAVLILLVAVISFGLGQRSVTDQVSNENKAGIVFMDVPEAEIAKEGIKIVGSRSGTKYHLLDCPGAEQMKEENKVFFDSIELAEAAGYTPAANCPGLQ